MPLDIVVTYDNGEKELFYAPLESMRGEKPAENTTKRTTLPDHRWVDATYEFNIPERSKNIAKIEIDPSRRMADLEWENNVWMKRVIGGDPKTNIHLTINGLNAETQQKCPL